ncbi:protein shank-like [Adelges cooleyi]|uniref:protein shank-like n=1 Tax=Adelges cooleyi TaxID=133065 RepID=UPI002180795D|nr:protein shank-like [Adelges cooleyi]
MSMMMQMRPSDSTPICRCRVLYLGSAVPHITKDGLQGIQEPLKELYPEQGALGARGIDSWLSVWSNGLLLENVDENHKKITRFFPIESLHYCAAVRFVLVPEKSNNSSQPRFLPLDSPFARSPNPNHPPLFAAILRRTSGIKVLECHTFICKREMAANALVRCCFHAYADSSYAKQVDTNGTNGSSIYGTLRTNRSMGNNTIEKVEGWRRMTNAGSTLTLNSAHSNGITTLEASTNSIDDLSECNGDENHKVWVGSTKDISEKDDIYTGGNTMRSSRSSRPRQIVGAAPPPPPPPPVRDEKASKKNKERPRRKRTPTGSGGGSREDLYSLSVNGGSLMRPMNGRSSVSLNGTIVSRGPPKGFMSPIPPPPPPPNHIYSNGTMMRPMNGFHHHHPAMMHPPPPPPPLMMVPTTLPHPKKMHKMKPGMMPVPRPGMMPPNFMPMPMYVHTGGKKPKHMQAIPMPLAMEEPIYMPSARPLSPIASYQPEHFPHEAYLMQQYANNNNNNNGPLPTKNKKDKKNKKKDSVSNGGVPVPQLAVNGNRVNGNGVSHDETDDTEESVYNTGIYRRKGHLNERAFSYSIRQEHRSRSYGSLANLKFAAPPIVPNGVDGVPKTDIKKEREIMQMMQDLELSGDELDRVDQVVHQNKMQQRPIKSKR